MLDSSTIKFEIIEHIGVLSEESGEWRKEINIIQWEHKDPLYDIRSWDVNYEHLTRGITFTENEMRKLIEHMLRAELKMEKAKDKQLEMENRVLKNCKTDQSNAK